MSLNTVEFDAKFALWTLKRTSLRERKDEYHARRRRGRAVLVGD
jgi:hypothetical protein